jgi:hypothetical protein
VTNHPKWWRTRCYHESMRNFTPLFTCMLGLLALFVAGCADTAGSATSTPGGPAQPLPSYDHIVVVVEENHSYSDIIGSGDAPYLNALAQQGALFTDAHAVTHPSEPNYLALFAGSTFGLSSDDCPQSFNAPNLASALAAQNRAFIGYSESMPSPGFTERRGKPPSFKRGMEAPSRSDTVLVA